MGNPQTMTCAFWDLREAGEPTRWGSQTPQHPSGADHTVSHPGTVTSMADS